MKKNKFVLLSLIIFSFIFPLFVFAAPTITLEFFSENANSQTGKLDLWLKVNTVSIPDGINVAVDLYKNGVKDGPTINVPITSNYGQYRSGSVLDPATNYTVQATALGATANFERVTSGNPVIGVDPPVAVTGISTTNTSNTYTLLAPIGGMTTAPTNIGDYFNKIFLIAIGLCGALAVIMIVIGGVQYMGDESIFGKTEAKSHIKNAILGLLIALAAYVLLNTINPDLLGKGGVNIQQVSAIINLPDAGDETVDPNFNTPNATYAIGSVSPGVTSALAKLQQGWTISGFQLNSSNKTMTISLKNESSVDTSSVVNVGVGASGYSNVGQGVVGDRKTPKGSWTILRMTTPGKGTPIYNATGSNMGASFWLLSPTNGGNRGIGIHGNASGTITSTAGCIRLTNADILALLPYVKTGTPVVIV